MELDRRCPRKTCLMVLWRIHNVIACPGGVRGAESWNRWRKKIKRASSKPRSAGK